MNIDLSIENQDITQALLVATPAKVKNALRSSIKTTTTWANKELDKRMALATDLPISIFKSHRIFKSNPLGLNGIEDGKIWIGYRRIRAKFAGPVNQGIGYLLAGSYHFPNGFMYRANVFSRRDRVKYRMTKGRYVGRLRERIYKEYIALPRTQEITNQVAAEAQTVLVNRFLAKFESNSNGVD